MPGHKGTWLITLKPSVWREGNWPTSPALELAWHASELLDGHLGWQ